MKKLETIEQLTWLIGTMTNAMWVASKLIRIINEENDTENYYFQEELKDLCSHVGILNNMYKRFIAFVGGVKND